MLLLYVSNIQESPAVKRGAILKQQNKLDMLLVKLTTAAALANRGGFIESGEASPEFQKLILILLLLAVVLSGVFTILDIKRDKKRLG